MASKLQSESSWFPTIRPMKPVTVELDWLLSDYWYVQPKVDGIRGILRLEQKPDLEFAFSFQTASGKQIPNIWLWKQAKEWAIGLWHFDPECRGLLKNGIDGELLVEGQPFQKTTSLVMSGNMSGVISFIAFDLVEPRLAFGIRSSALGVMLNRYNNSPEREDLGSRFRCYPLETKVVSSRDEIQVILDDEIARGGEGIILRSPNSKYLFGRASLRNLVISRIKPLEQAEAQITGLFEGETNENPLYIDELGRSKRSTSAKGMIPNGQLGGFVVECPALFKNPFRIGTIKGMTEIERIRIWENRAKQDYLGMMITFRYMKLGSTKDAPRQPIGIGFRDPRDLTDY
jgi:DNA ligase-1